MEVGEYYHGFFLGLPKSMGGNDAVCVIVDRLTKLAHLLPIQTTFNVTPQLGTLCQENDVTNLRTINILTYIILNNYLEKISLQFFIFIYTHCSGIYNVLYIYYESHLLILLHLHCLQNLIFTFTKSSQTYMWWTPTVVLVLLYAEYHRRPLRYVHG